MIVGCVARETGVAVLTPQELLDEKAPPTTPFFIRHAPPRRGFFLQLTFYGRTRHKPPSAKYRQVSYRQASIEMVLRYRVPMIRQ
jgi:hypothetical protein